MKRNELSHAVRQSLTRLPAPHASHYGVVPAAPPEQGVVITDVARRHELAVQAMAAVDVYARTLSDPFVVSRILTRQEAVSSSAIEGTQSTLDELLTEEETHDEDGRAQVRQVKAYAAALEAHVRRARRLGPEVFTQDLVGQLHRKIMRGDPDYPDRPGRIRDVTVWIGTGGIAYSTFNPPPAANVAACLADNVSYMQAQGLHAQQQSLLTRMAIAHSHFEAVHPFRDGNGRVGRLLLPMMMAAEGRTPLYLAPYIEANKPAYYTALKASQQKLDWPAMVGFLSDAVVGSTDELMKTREALLRLEAKWEARRVYRGGSSSLRALKLLPQYPVVTIARLAELLKVSVTSAATAVDQLQSARILKERTGYARNRVFFASEALSILNRPFGADPILPRR